MPVLAGTGWGAVGIKCDMIYLTLCLLAIYDNQIEMKRLHVAVGHLFKHELVGIALAQLIGNSTGRKCHGVGQTDGVGHLRDSQFAGVCYLISLKSVGHQVVE